MLQEIRFVHFRNFSSGELKFSGSDVVLFGRNGCGKSNLLEAVNHLSILRSFRGAKIREEIQIGENAFFLSAKLKKNGKTKTLSVKESVDGRRELFVDDSRRRKSSEFIGEFQTVPFVPEDRMIVGGHSGFRRKFFDVLLSALDVRYFFALVCYNRALDQRNRALKENAPEVAAAFEEELAARGMEIGRFREKYNEKIVERMNFFFAGKYRFDGRYLRAFPENEEEYRKKLRETRARDVLKKYTSCGVQLDDFEWKLDGKLLRGYGSSGQQRLCALLLRLAHFDLLRKENASVPLVALIDDVTGELDEENFDRFLENISGADQRIFTFAAVPDKAVFRRAQQIPVEQIEDKTK